MPIKCFTIFVVRILTNFKKSHRNLTIVFFEIFVLENPKVDLAYILDHILKNLKDL